MNTLKIYRIKDDYIKYLKEYDDTVMENKPDGKRRPYVGIVVEINSFKYYIPLTSPKRKHLTMKNNIDFLKINNGEHGAMNINNMIPVKDSELIHFNIQDEEDESYKNLLINQHRFIKDNTDRIIKNANKLYEKVVIKEDRNFIKKCSKFKLLEEKCNQYKG